MHLKGWIIIIMKGSLCNTIKENLKSQTYAKFKRKPL